MLIMFRDYYLDNNDVEFGNVSYHRFDNKKLLQRKIISYKSYYRVQDDDKQKAVVKKLRPKLYMRLHKLIILVQIFQNFVNLTETNTENQLQSNPMYYSERFKIPSDSNWTNNFEYEPARINSRTTKFKYKVSPTRIKFTSSSNKIKTNNKISKENSRLSRDYDNLQLNSIVSFTHLKPKHSKQMAPAYELWPNLIGNLNQIVKDNKPISSLNADCSSNQQKTYEKSNSNLDFNSNTNKSFEKLSYLRSLLPKPVTMLPSGTNKRSFKVRSTVERAIQKVILNKNLNDDEEDNTDQSNDNNNIEESDENSSLMSDPESTITKLSQTNRFTDDDKFIDSNKQILVNFKLIDNKQAMIRAESRKKLSQSPVYPPGDLERLYSDALLVYVKDFNQYIKE